MTRRQGRRVGRKVRARRKGGKERQAGDGDGTVLLTEEITDDGDGADEARHQCAWGNNSNNGMTAPPQAAAGAAHRGGGDAVGGWLRGAYQ